MILLSEAYAIHEKWFQERPEDYGELARQRIVGGAFIRAADYVNGTRVKAQLVEAYNEAMTDFDVAITASSMDPACEIEDAEATERTYGRQARAPAAEADARAPTLLPRTCTPWVEGATRGTNHATRTATQGAHGQRSQHTTRRAWLPAQASPRAGVEPFHA